LYLDDHDGTYLPSGNGTGVDQDRANYQMKGPGWLQMLQPYARTYALQGCPSSDYKMGYGYNRTHQNHPDYGVSDLVTTSDITDSSGTILFGDAAWVDRNGKEYHWSYQYMGPSPFVNAWPGQMANRHQGGGNLLFADAHVKWMKKAMTWRSRTDNLWDRR
ncbi:MAG: hypothetical protein KY468_13575, partial [Armatimonadetes bacterium]|nr:hypothetical protein [Armatimonadota bacterium]